MSLLYVVIGLDNRITVFLVYYKNKTVLHEIPISNDI